MNKTLNADFDGDILNIIGISSDELKYIFRKFNPVERMIMSRDSGLLNDYFSISKSQLIDLSYFLLCDVGVEDMPQEVRDRLEKTEEEKRNQLAREREAAKEELAKLKDAIKKNKKK